MTLTKRIFDIVFALALGILLLPFQIVVAVLILILDGRPIFYVSERMKSVNGPFSLFKFRTMRTDTQANTGVTGGEKTSRITRTGKLLRKTRLDELPQLWNILIGDMSFVGPRPPLRQYVDRFPEIYSEVLSSRPGVTGLASLKFHKHEEKILKTAKTPEETDMLYSTWCIPRKAQLDIIYARNSNICLDLLIMLKTVESVLRR